MTLGIVFLVMGGTLSMVLRREGGKVEGEQWELPQMLVLGRGSIFFLALTALESGAEVSGVHQLLLVELD